MQGLRERLDTGASFDGLQISPHSLAEALLELLFSLAEPVIPASLMPAHVIIEFVSSE